MLIVIILCVIFHLYLETLRLYPVVQILNRICVKDYKIPDTNITIEKGTPIIVPLFSLHRDEKYYTDAEKFDPSRFFSENKDGKTSVDMPYSPFGDGPRNCIGLRMGKMSTKVGIVTVLQNYWIELADQHKNTKLKFSAATFVLATDSGIHLELKPRKS